MTRDGVSLDPRSQAPGARYSAIKGEREQQQQQEGSTVAGQMRNGRHAEQSKAEAGQDELARLGRRPDK